MSLPQPFIDLVRSAEFDALRNAMAAVLNKPDQPGLVPIVELARYCAKGITGGVQAALETPIGTGGMTAQAKGALHTVMNLVQNDFRMEFCDTSDPAFTSTIDGVLIPMGIMTAADKANLIALGNNRISRAEKLLGRFCTGTDCLTATGGL
jgi:hypothetical protein